MIHIATVHFKFRKWVDLQLRYLKRYIDRPYRLYAFVYGIESSPDEFYFCSREGVNCCPPSHSHAAKLNILADIISAEASRDDLIIFLDGDAFPIKPFLPFVLDKVNANKLVAVRRDDNSGDIQPHPSFCATTVGFWNEIGGDWHPGFTWTNRQGDDVTDTGGNLLRILQAHKVDWYPLTRSNTHDLHPLWFGIYGGFVYHHGAAFRAPISRADVELLERSYPYRTLIKRLRSSDALLLRALGKPFEMMYSDRRWESAIKGMVKANEQISDRVISKIESDFDFWRELA